MNVLWIISDTMRADCLGVNGGDVHTPNLDALAARSVTFRRAQIASFPPKVRSPHPTTLHVAKPLGNPL